jgi:predicted metal-dependent hydrolase
MNQPPRLAPELALPHYAYVPGTIHPHPTSDPRGHSYRKKPDDSLSFSPDSWQTCQPFLFGIDLFNHGYYWEAHESWESLWRLCDRQSKPAKFLKALIKLAAAGVKRREGVPAGVQSHAERAKQLLHEIGDIESNYMGLRLTDLIHLADRFLETGAAVETDSAPLDQHFWMIPVKESNR